ncbi:hypothetical protein CASFOL_022597 [Castilleja foliolosa]|uniref:VQ domain-containing protein n=1 Tax=Castilleja foliolosa TaxID=1961234 RepID=A0ABD3CYT7_9LAMI
MATSQTMSNPSDWLSQSFHTDFFNTSQTETPPITVAGGGSTTSADSRNNHLSPDQGRVAKPLRRRSRASRRTPTTLFNTDTSNFRAMVQRFTGGPAASFAAESRAPSGGGRGLNFMEHIAEAAAARQGSGFHMQYPNQGLQQQQQMMLMMGGGGGVQAAPAPRSASANENRSYENYML